MTTNTGIHFDMRFFRTSLYILLIFILTSTGFIFADEKNMQLGGPVEITTEVLPYGYKSVDYSARIYVTGGTGEYIFHPTSLPAGLTLNESGRLEGIIAASIGTHSFRVVVSDTLKEANLYEKVLKLTIFEKLAFKDEATLPAVKGVFYKQKINVSGGSGDFGYEGKGFPEGLNIDDVTGIISGTPIDRPDRYDIEITVIDKKMKDKKIVRSELFTLYPTLKFKTKTLPVIKKKSETEIAIEGDGGSRTYRFSSGNLPSGLKIDTNGRITGATAVKRGTYNFTVKVIDPNTHVSAEKQLPITIVDFFPDQYEALGDNDLNSTNTMLPGGDTRNHSFDKPGDADFTRLDLKSIQPGDVIRITVHRKKLSVKPVLTIYDSDKTKIKTISPDKKNNTVDYLFKCTTPGIYYTGAKEASDETGEYSLSITNIGPATRFETQSLPDVLKNSKISLTLRGIDGSGNYQFSEVGLPKGFKLSNKGIITGKVNIPAGKYSFKATIKDRDWKNISETRTFTLHVVDFFPDSYEFSIDNDFETQNKLLPGIGTQNHNFNKKGDKDYVKLDFKKVRPGNIIDIQTSRLTVATKTAVTLYNADKSVVLTSSHKDNYPRIVFECKKPAVYYLLMEERSNNTGDYRLSVFDTGPKVSFKTKTIPDMLKKGKTSFKLQTIYGSGNFHFSSKNLPGKFSLSNKGLLSVKDDTGLKKGTYPFSVTLRDLDYPGIVTEKQFTLTIVDFFPDQFELAGDNNFGTSNRVRPENVFQYHTFNQDGDIDYLGLDLSKVAKGNVICISTSVKSASVKADIELFNHQKKVLKPEVDSKQNASPIRYFKCTEPGQYFLKISEPEKRTGDYGLYVNDVGPAPVITTESLPDVRTGRKYSKKMMVKDGSGHYRFKASGLSDKLSINSTGVISGKLPAVSGVYPFEVIVEDTRFLGITARKKLTLNVVDFFPDQYEKSGDNNFFTTNRFSPGEKAQQHTFNFKGDVDYTRIDLSGCRSDDLIKIRAERLSRKSAIDLALYDSDFKKIMKDTGDKDKDYSQIIFLCKSPGLYYLKTSERKSDVGSYKLSLINTGQQLRISAASIADVLRGQPYQSQLLIEGGSGKFRIKADNMPTNLSINHKGIITGTTKIKSNQTWQFNITAHDEIHPENTVKKTISVKVVDYYPDQYEKNNDNDFSTTNTLLSGQQQKHNFNFLGDEDFIRLNLTTAAPNDVIIIESSKSGKLTDTYFTLYNNLQKELVQNDNSGTSSYSKIVFICQEPGIYYLKTSEANKATGAYLIKMNNSGQPVTIKTKDLPMAESPIAYSGHLQTSGGCGKYIYSIKKGTLPPGLSLNPKSGQLTGKNKNWGAFTFTVTAKDKKFPENQTEKKYLINAYIGKKLSGTESVTYPFYVGQTLNAEGIYNKITAVPSLIRGGIKKNLRYQIISHNIPENRFDFSFDKDTAELKLKEAATVTCEGYQNFDMDVTIEVRDTINKNNSMKFRYEIPVKCLVY